MIVVDANIIVYLWLPSEFSSEAEKLLQKDSNWVAPILWKSEFRNVISSFYRKEYLTFEESIEVILNAKSQLKNNEYFINSLKVMKKVKISGCTAYDCEYVALAEELNCKLITKDKKLIKSFPSLTVELERYL